MTREIALHCMKSASELERELCEECPIYGQTGCDHCYEDALQYVIDMLEQEPQSFKWCTDCKEYDQEKHCCHRYSKVIRNTVAEIKQEPVLDKLRAEIVELTECPYGSECLGANCPSNTDCMICGDHVLEIIDKYKAEREDNG